MADLNSGDVPRVIVFDLDGTLWNPEMYQLSGGAPFKPHNSNSNIMIDRAGTPVELIGETRAVLQRLATEPQWSSTLLAISSTCDEPSWATELLQKFKFTGTDGRPITMGSLFGELKEIYYANKSAHHSVILKKASRIDPSIQDPTQMLFFDNQTNNINSVGRIGVTACYCPSGMVQGTFERGLAQWRKDQKSKM